MSAINQAVWRADALRRRRLRRLMMLVGAILLLVNLVIWFIVTQPLFFSTSNSNAKINIEPSRLEAHVRMLAETFAPRDCAHPSNLERVAGYIRAEFEHARGTVSEQRFQVDDESYCNIIASFGPDSAERIVVGAHYDSAGARPAADDNASGVAGLIELAYLLGNNPPPMRVELVAFTLEEPPYFRTEHMGSAVHARALKASGAQLRAMFSLEMIGYFSDAPNSQQYPLELLKLFYPTRGNFITVVGGLGGGMLVRKIKQAMSNGAPLPVYSINAPNSIPGIDFSDHLNYWNEGYPAVMITNTAFYRNTRYHTIEDTPETLDYHRMAMVVAGVYQALLAVAK